jgi:hypothetical protein
VIQFHKSRAIAHHTAGSGERTALEYRGKAVAGSQGAKVSDSAEIKLIVSDDEAACLRLAQLSKNITKITSRTRPDDLYLRATF